MSYAVLGEGKRLRPQLLLATCEALVGNFSDAALDFACAIEMIHAYSLAHDDLPAMDNDDFRRGRPTCHKAYTEASAILAGDGLLSLAVEVMANRISDASNESIQAAKALTTVIKAAGVNGMVAGQVVDIQNEGKRIDADTLAGIHKRKTGCLFTACFEAGAILAGADDDIRCLVVELGSVVGLAFQVRDDILDVTSTEAKLGKPIGSDSKNQKTTYITLHGLDKAEAEYTRLITAAYEMLGKVPQKKDALHQLVTRTLHRER